MKPPENVPRPERSPRGNGAEFEILTAQEGHIVLGAPDDDAADHLANQRE